MKIESILGIWTTVANKSSDGGVVIKIKDDWTFCNVKSFLTEAKIEHNEAWEYPYHMTCTTSQYLSLLNHIGGDVCYFSHNNMREAWAEETKALLAPKVVVMSQEQYELMTGSPLPGQPTESPKATSPATATKNDPKKDPDYKN